ncbi:hypothetical protein L6164_020541 [Bauhinia variegata]|uniref:Uncharacterized protein n=1 Tax=Bauhinia variegata TaxID=167791 RepID=A0ACB9MVQ0_BAUVA|nr:hypothetical protein L6164_020541 [Bauhinia variegata]
MDPNPDHFPLICFVLNQLDPHVYPPLPKQLEPTLLAHFPHLFHPKVLNDLIQLIPQLNITQTLSLLRFLGPRQDPSSVAAALAKIAEIQSNLAVIDDDGTGDRERTEELKKAAQMYETVVRLDDMHEEYEKKLRDAEQSLVEAYGAAAHPLQGFHYEVNEEVIEILSKAEKEQVERVELSGRQLRLLPDAFGKLRGLLVLNLSRKQLQVIPDSIAGLQKLEELDISSNLLVSLPDSIGLLINLRVLNVSGNKLDALPEAIAHCRSLVALDASFNNLMCLPTNMGCGLINLEKLLIHLNKIRLLPPSIGEMRSLRYLDAHFNELRGLPHSIGRLTNLEYLNLGSNFSDLTELPETFGDLVNLRELDVSNNQIHALPYTFGRLERLAKLNLEENPIIIPPQEVVDQGVEAVKEFMAKWWVQVIAEEQQKSTHEAETGQAQIGWLGWGTSLLKNAVSGVSGTVTEYFGARKAYRDPWMDQQL